MVNLSKGAREQNVNGETVARPAEMKRNRSVLFKRPFELRRFHGRTVAAT